MNQNNLRALPPATIASLIFICSGAIATQPIDLAPYAIGMTRAAAKSAGYDNCQSQNPADPKANVTCRATQGLRHWPTFKEIQLEFTGPKLDSVSKITARTSLSDAELATAFTPIAPPRTSGSRHTYYIGSNDVIGTTLNRAASRGNITFTKEPGIYRKQAAFDAKNAAREKAASEKLKNF